MFERERRAEKQPTQYDLQNLTPQTEDHLRDLISGQGGSARFFVHPWYMMHTMSHLGLSVEPIDIIRHASGHDSLSPVQQHLFAQTMQKRRLDNPVVHDLRFDGRDLTPRYKNYLKLLGRILNDDTPLLFLAEVHNLVDDTVDTMRQLGYKGTIVWYGTEDGRPDPQQGTMGHVVETLGEIGVTHLLMGGQYLAFKDPQTTGTHSLIYKMNDHRDKHAGAGEYPRGTPRFCVGIVIDHAYRQYIDITVSRATFPASVPDPKDHTMRDFFG